MKPDVSEQGVERRLASLGERVLEQVDRCGRFVLLVGATFRAARRPRFPLLETVRQMEAIGSRSTTIVLITALFTGMVLALQTGIALERFGAKLYVGSVVGISLARELGPVLTALMVGGRVGAGITAEIGAMQVTEQIDAIRSMGADPVQKLVLPRVLAATLALPLLTVLAVVLGVMGGLLIAVTQFGITPNFYLDTIYSTVTVEDLLEELVGEIEDEDDEPVPQVRRLKPGAYWVDGTMRVDELNEVLELSLEEGEYDTLAGLVLDRLERVPKAGERLRENGVWLEVLAAEPHRIHALRVVVDPREEAE